MARQQSIVNLDPIDRKKKKGIIGRLLVTRWYRGKSVVKSEPYGHYMFCGKQRSGKTASVLWYAEWLAKKYSKRKIKYADHELCDDTHKKCRMLPFDTPPKVKLWSNFGIGRHVNKEKVFELIDEFDPYANEVRIVLIDEFHTYFPKDSTSSKDKEVLGKLTAVFSQLAKRNCYVLSTAQVYGRLDKRLREQCLYMVDNRVNMRNKIVSDFILESDIMCDDLGRWAGDPRFIKVHGLAGLNYDTKRLIRE